MMMAGYESTANALAFTLYLLALNRDKEACIIAEVEAFGTDRAPSYADLARLVPCPSMHASLVKRQTCMLTSHNRLAGRSVSVQTLKLMPQG